MSRPRIAVALVGIMVVSVVVLALYPRPTVPADWWRLTWHLDPAYPVTPDTRVVHVLANEGNCTSETEKRLQPPVVEYRASEIEIGLYVSQHSNLLTSCNDIPVAIELAEPVGARALTGGTRN